MEVAMSSLSSMSRLLLAFTLLTSACAGSMPGAGGSSSSSPALVDPPRRQGKPLILIAMPDSASFRSVRRALVEEIKKDLDVVTQIVESTTTLAAFTAQVDTVHPACLVLMDNPTVRLYRAYQKNV